MINLIDYIMHKTLINVYFDADGYWIDEIDWNDAIYELGGMDENWNAYEYLYNVAAGKLCKEIYRRTQAEEIRMFCDDGKIRKYVWAENIGAYYHKYSHTLI
jgi:hypothetical protein